ncbi:hypothetical protein YC2023_089440 [Brassica napus]
MKRISYVKLQLLESSDKMDVHLSHAPAATGSWRNMGLPSSEKCDSPHVTGVISNIMFRVELFVDDGKDSATFTVFNNEMTKLTKKIDVLALDVEVEDIDEYGGGEYIFPWIQ